MAAFSRQISERSVQIPWLIFIFNSSLDLSTETNHNKESLNAHSVLSAKRSQYEKAV